MKNIALCLYGYYSNKGGDNLNETSYIYDNIINKIIPDNNLDIFIHSFDIKNKENILKKYPTVKKYIIEPQIDFDSKLSAENIEFVNILKANPGNIENYFSTLSMFYSKKQSILMTDDTYDCIILTRHDIGIRQKSINATKDYLEEFGNACDLFFNYSYFSDIVNNDYIISSYWQQLNAGPSGYYFIANYKNMVILSNMYDYIINEAFKIDSNYCKTLNDWPDSNFYDQYSNEMLKNNNHKDNTIKRSSYLINYASNNHLLLKYYFIITGLYNKCKFLRSLSYNNNTIINT
jgi:hypothetical protein